MLTDRHREAVERARRLIAERQRGEWHSVAAVLLTEAGGSYLAINVDCTLPRAGVCAEPVAIGMAVTAEAAPVITFSAAVNRRGEVIPPCGVCRELLLDYAADALVAVPNGADFAVRPLCELVPDAYKAGRRRPG